MEFYIRPLLNAWPDLTLARLDRWVEDENYHVRRLISEGTRPRLPWAKNIELDPAVPLRFLDALHGDRTRYVTRSVANHMNDLSKVMPDRVLTHLSAWRDEGCQEAKELGWISRHALRTAVKRGEAGALAHLGYRAGAVEGAVTVPEKVQIGEALPIEVTLHSAEDLPVMIDYRLRFARPTGPVEKVFKLKATEVKAGRPLTVKKAHRLKGDATTFTLHPGKHRVVIQVNGQDVAQAAFDVLPAQ